MVLLALFTYSQNIIRIVFNAIFIVLNSYEHFKLIESNHQLNPFDSFRTHFSLGSSVSYHPSFTSVVSIFKYFRRLS